MRRRGDGRAGGGFAGYRGGGGGGERGALPPSADRLPPPRACRRPPAASLRPSASGWRSLARRVKGCASLRTNADEAGDSRCSVIAHALSRARPPPPHTQPPLEAPHRGPLPPPRAPVGGRASRACARCPSRASRRPHPRFGRAATPPRAERGRRPRPAPTAPPGGARHERAPALVLSPRSPHSSRLLGPLILARPRGARASWAVFCPSDAGPSPRAGPSQAAAPSW